MKIMHNIIQCTLSMHNNYFPKDTDYKRKYCLVQLTMTTDMSNAITSNKMTNFECDPFGNHTKSPKLIHKANTCYHRPLYPRMGVQHHIHKQITKIGTIDTSTTRVINTDNYAPKLLRRNHLSILEQQSKLQEKLRTARSGQILLNTMMPTTRQPIKAKHVLQNENISESKDVNSSTNDTKSWRLPKYDVTESRRSIASSLNDPCSYQRITIFTNPDAQRRLSTDGVTLERQSTVEDLNWNNDIPTPAKRQYIDHSFVTSKLDLPDKNNDTSACSSCNSNNNLLSCDCIPSTNTSNINSSSSLSCTLKKQIIYLKKHNRWSIDTSKRSTPRRSSTGSLKLEIEKVNNNHNVNDIIYESNLQRTNLLKGIRRSARRTFSNLCSMLRYSNNNLTNVYNNSNIYDNQLCSDRISCNQHPTVTLPSLLSYELNDLVKESVYDNSKLQYNHTVISSNLRFITLTRSDLNEPFGLFVIKSEQGYRITRLSERFIQNNVANQISIGDEIIQVNMTDSKNYTIHELQELFQKNLSLLLTIIHQCY